MRCWQVQKSRKQSQHLVHLRENLGSVIFKGFDKGIVGGQRAQCTAHMSVDDLKTVNVTGIDPAETTFTYYQHVVCNARER